MHYIRQLFRDAFEQLEAVIADTPDALLTWTPPGSANSIAVIYAHTLLTLDFHIHRVCLQQPMLWSAFGLEESLGVAEPPHTTWEQFKAMQFELAAFQPYAQAVYRAAADCLERLRDDDLTRTVSVLGRERVVADSLLLAARHTLTHTGEIAALKGVQGAQGLPF